MGDKSLNLGDFEELVLLAVMSLQKNAYGVTIRQAIAEATKNPIAIGAIYTTLERLEQKGYVSSYHGDPTPERGGRAKRYFEIEGPGARALDEAQRTRDTLRRGLRPSRGVV
jgi:PadR family transcriptional regulator PadR